VRTGLKTDFFSPRLPRAIAHRGGGGDRPENTPEAFAAAYRKGSRYFELDVHTSRDGVLVVCHDPDLERTTDLTGTIRGLSYAEIARGDAGYRFANDLGEFPFRGAGIRVPTLNDILGMFDDTFFVIEIKQTDPSLTAALNQALTTTAMRRRVLIASEHQQPLDEVRALAPELPTSFSAREIAVFFAALTQGMKGYRAPADALQIPVTWDQMLLATPASVAAVHDLGIEAHVWTINEEAEMRDLLALGADGILTDYPARLFSVIA
jgi:glycerophosphoryl diester phosphodiesterase